MPYINEHEREAFTPEPMPWGNIGQLNFAITKMCEDYLSQTSGNYAALNSVVGALESAKLEFYRRIVAPYEEEKCKQNGDVYGA